VTVLQVYTPIKAWSSTRKEEYKLRRWEDINAATEAVRNDA